MSQDTSYFHEPVGATFLEFPHDRNRMKQVSLKNSAELRGFREDAVCPDVVAHTQVRRPSFWTPQGCLCSFGRMIKSHEKKVVNDFWIFLGFFWVLNYHVLQKKRSSC